VYAAANRKPSGPFYPTQKLAIVLVTRSGCLKILYQLPDGKWGEMTSELKSLSSSDEVLTHAAISSTTGILSFLHGKVL
jgi:mediator of RNA polymerase II transcription subunit 16, fungi type